MYARCNAKARCVEARPFSAGSRCRTVSPDTRFYVFTKCKHVRCCRSNSNGLLLLREQSNTAFRNGVEPGAEAGRGSRTRGFAVPRQGEIVARCNAKSAMCRSSLILPPDPAAGWCRRTHGFTFSRGVNMLGAGARTAKACCCVNRATPPSDMLLSQVPGVPDDGLRTPDVERVTLYVRIYGSNR